MYFDHQGVDVDFPFLVLSQPDRSRQMAALLESGSA